MQGEAVRNVRPRVLVVEDDYLISTEISHALEEAGAQVIGPVMSVAAALTFTEQFDVLDGAVLDIGLRGETVYPVAQSLRRHGVPFVFTTGYSRAVIPQEFASVECFEKPFDYHATIKMLLASPLWMRAGLTTAPVAAPPSLALEHPHHLVALSTLSGLPAIGPWPSMRGTPRFTQVAAHGQPGCASWRATSAA